MRYWGYFAAKLIALTGILRLAWIGLVRVMGEPDTFNGKHYAKLGQDLTWTFAIMGFFLLSVGLLFLVVHDQRYRCRSCLRPLRMPVAHGSWGGLFLFGPPRTEYICLYGHGTLKVPELHITGHDPNRWEEHTDMWKELFELEDSAK